MTTPTLTTPVAAAAGPATTPRIRGLSVRQPWAHCIATGDKTIENRRWPTDYRGLVLIHASKSADGAALRHPLVARLAPRGRRLPLGAVIAVADFTGCHPDDGPCTPWAQAGLYHWTLARVRPLPTPLPCTGRLRLWHPTRQMLAAIRDQDPRLFADLPEQANGTPAPDPRR